MLTYHIGFKPIIIPDCKIQIYGHKAVVYGDDMIIFGRCNYGVARLNKMWYFNLKTYNWQILNCPCPASRDYHSMVLTGDKLIVFGGRDGYTWYNDTWVMLLKSQQWYEIKTTNKPSTRNGHSAVMYNNDMYIFGGWNGNRRLNDMYRLSTDSSGSIVWSKIQYGGIISPRDNHIALTYKDTMIIIGGSDHNTNRYKYNYKTNTMHIYDTVNPPYIKSNVGVIVDDILYIGTGGDGVRWISELYMLNLKSDIWYKLVGESFVDRYGICMVNYKNKLVFYGGGNTEWRFNTVFIQPINYNISILNIMSKLYNNRSRLTDIVFLF